MSHDRSLDHLIYDGMGYSDGHTTVGSTRPTGQKSEWVFERSSGYAGYRNMKTGEWIYESEYQKRFD